VNSSIKNILIVDDMPSDLRLLKILMQSPEYNLITAASASEALDLVKTNCFSLILLDVIMPGMDGVELAKRLRSNQSTAAIPIIFVSSLSKPSRNIMDGYSPETVAYIEKPLKADVLKNKVDYLLNVSSGNSADKEQCVYIACRSKLYSKAFAKSCRSHGLKPVMMSSERSIFDDLERCKPKLIYIQDAIINEVGHSIVDDIKSHDVFTDSYLVVGSAEKSGVDVAENLEADFFLPIPFLKNQVSAIFRQVLNLPKKIILVSSQKKSFKHLLAELDKLKYEVMWVSTGEEARIAIQEFFPDIIYSKFDLSDMTGAELCLHIKQKPIFKHIHFLIETENNTAEVMSECFEAGADDIVLEKQSRAKKLKVMTSLVSSPSSGRKSSVLLVVKGRTVKGKITRLLRRHNFNVVSIDQASEVGTRVSKESFDAIIVSYNIALEDDWGFCINLLSDTRTQDIPIVMLATENQSGDLKKLGNLLSVAATVFTPFKNDEFLSAVQNVVEGSHARLEKNELEKYLPQDAVKHVGEVFHGIKDANVEQKFITILFTDICSFTAKCEELEPEHMVRLLNHYFDLMTDVIMRNNGIVDKFIGDAVLARFDSGDKHADAMNAIRTSLDMFSVLNEYNASTAHPFKVRVGINSGDVVLGNIGSTSHLRNYTMIGDNVNIAQRLESEAPPLGCYLAEATRDLLDESVEVGDLNYIKVKGKKIPVGICELISIKS